MQKLTAKQKAFVDEYLVDLNATQAAIRAGYSAKTAMEQGYQLIHKASVAQAIQAGMEKRAKRTEITADRVLQELAKLAFANIEDYTRIDDNGMAQVDLTNVSTDQFAAITEITVDSRKEAGGQASLEKTRLKLADKGINLERLGRHLKLFTDKQEIDTSFHITIGNKDAKGL